MNRPTLEVADIIRASVTVIGNGTDHIWPGSIVRCLTPSPAAAPRLWAVIAISALAAVIRPSLRTPAATGTAPMPGKRTRQVAGRAPL